MRLPTDHARPLPASVVARGAATDCPHGFSTEPTTAPGAGTPEAETTNTHHA